MILSSLSLKQYCIIRKLWLFFYLFFQFWGSCLEFFTESLALEEVSVFEEKILTLYEVKNTCSSTNGAKSVLE